MKILKKALRIPAYLILALLSYLLIAYLLTGISVNKEVLSDNPKDKVYLSTNGIHLDIILPMHLIDTSLQKGVVLSEKTRYCAFGWGDRAFYLYTPTWQDLTFGNTFRAAFLKSPSLMHLTQYQQARQGWVAVPISATQLQALNQFIATSFLLDEKGEKQILPDQSYGTNDAFYEGVGSYSVLYNCNTWANDAFKTSGLKACFWTVFDFGLLGKY